MRKTKRLQKMILSLSVAFLITLQVMTPALMLKVNANGDESQRDVYSDTWGLTDELGRKAPDYEKAGGVKADKKVGIFYLVWHDKLMDIAVRVDKEAPRNISQIIGNNPESFIYDASLYGPVSSMHYWGEPLYGYYNLRYDQYVIRQHATQLTDAGVDFITIDATNFFGSGFYDENADDTKTITTICDEYLEMRKLGMKTPEITFLFTWNPNYNGQAIRYFYDKLYSNPKYSELWFRREGKPLVMGAPDFIGESTMGNKTSAEDVKNYFSYRRVQPEMTEASGGSWNWLAKFPQEVGFSESNIKECMAVGVAQNWADELVFMTSVDEYGRFNARGRSWTSESSKLLKNPVSEEYNSKYGYNFQEQFDRAKDIDPDILFVTAWNEWIAGRFDEVPDWAGGGELPNRANFGDDFSTEFSREIEMTREGGLNDNFYNQLASNIREFKGIRKAPNNKAVATQNIDGNFSDWKAIPEYYRDTEYDKTNRDSKSFGQVKDGAEVKYINKTGRNDFSSAKVARDDDNLYFYVSTVDDITPYTDANWMRLFIKTGEEKNWNGFNYVINNTQAKKDTLTLEKSQGGFSWQKVSEDIKYKVSGNEMEICIPRDFIGMDKAEIEFEFKWDDNITNGQDALNWYTDGDTAPNSRFTYVYSEISQSDDFTSYVEMYDFNTSADNKENISFIKNTDTAAAKFTSSADFRGVDISAYNMLNKKAEYTLKLYNFDTSYSKTVLAKPLLTRKITNAYNNTPLYIGAEIIPKGTYLLEVSNVSTTEDNFAGLNTLKGQDVTTCYVNGKLVSSEMFQIRLHSYLNCENQITSVKATSEENASKLFDKDINTEWTNLPSNILKDEEIIIDLGESKSLFGIRLNPYIKDNKVEKFPISFEFLVSEDGVNYKKINKQSYTNYVATATNQDFRFNTMVQGRYVKIKISDMQKLNDKYQMSLSGVSVLSQDNYKYVEPKPKNNTLPIVLAISLSALVAIAGVVGAYYIIDKKKRGKNN